MLKPILSTTLATGLAMTALVPHLQAASFAEDAAFLQQHTDAIVLTNKSGSALVVVPKYQGRVMTSTADGTSSFGWVNRELIASGEVRQHINPLGGEDRFWLGPEGGQFSIFFAQGAAFDLDHWYTPAPLDTEPFTVTKQTAEHVDFRQRFNVVNYSGTKFDVEVDRRVRLMSQSDLWHNLRLPAATGVHAVAFESINKITNRGTNAWTKSTGLISIWILGMMNASPATTVVLPFQTGPDAELGAPINTDYFGPIPNSRLAIKDGAAFFRADFHYRSKVGLNPKRVKPVLGSYDASAKVLTILQFRVPAGTTDYVNSKWKLQDQPFAGDVANSYNDGPATPGAKQLGEFYEMESSSPAVELAPGKAVAHFHRTYHLQGSEAELDAIARKVLGVSLKQITGALPPL